MKVICSKNDLLDAITVCQRAVSTRSSQSILEGILIEANEDLKFTSFDTQISINKLCMAEVLEKGSVVINAKLLLDVVRKLPEGEIILEKKDNSVCSLSSSHSVFELKILEAEVFPKIETVKYKEDDVIILEESMLKSLINKTVFAVSMDKSRPNLNGALLNIEDSEISMVAIDGFRLAVARINPSDEDRKNINLKDTKVIIHGKTLKELVSLLNDRGSVKIALSDNHILFEFDGIKLVSTLLQAEFMNYKKILPSTSTTVVYANAKNLLNAFDRSYLMVVTGDNRFPVTLSSIDNQTIKLSINALKGSFEEEVTVNFEGDDISADFHPGNFLDALKVIDDEEIKIEFSGDVGPCLISPVTGNAFSYLLLPLRKPVNQ